MTWSLGALPTGNAVAFGLHNAQAAILAHPRARIPDAAEEPPLPSGSPLIRAGGGRGPDGGRWATLALASLALGLCLPGLVGAWGFSVDDAWIVRRVVLNSLSGRGYVFNSGQVTDAITPFGFAQVVAVISRVSSVDPLLAARSSGLVLTSCALWVAAYWAFHRLASPRERLLGLFAWGAVAGPCLPLAAWAGAGLATGLVGLLLTLGVLLFWSAGGGFGLRSHLGAFLAGAAGALRPELVPVGFAALLLAGTRLTGMGREHFIGARFSAAVCFALPSAIVMGWRWKMFGALLPLAASAKAPVLALGVRYAVGGALLVGPLWLLWPHLLRRGEQAREARKTGAVFVAHALALSLAGGDWMALFRLWVPVLPLALAVGVSLIPQLPLRALWLALGLGANLTLQIAFGSDARSVVACRHQLIAHAAPALRGATRIAAVDIGWLGAATDAPIVDLAGVTDPTVAALPGGHTSKTISPGFFSARDIDAWVVRASDRGYRVGAPLTEVHAAYVVDARLLQHAEDLRFTATAVIPLGGTEGQYVILRHQP